jgi:hypothetical protein
MRKSNFALRLQPSLLAEARKVAEAEGVALNQLINVALAEKLSALRTASYFGERAARADILAATRILDRAGVGQPPVKGDELPDAAPKRRASRRRRGVHNVCSSTAEILAIVTKSEAEAWLRQFGDPV